MRFTFFRFTRLSRSLVTAFVVGILLAAFTGPAAWAETPAGNRIFPDTTKGFITIKNLKELQTKWRETQIGQLMNDPIMESFKADMRGKLEAGMEKRFGFTLDTIAGLPSGEVAAGMIAIPDTMPGYVIVLGVADRLEETKDYLKRLEEKLQKSGTTKKTEKHKNLEYIVFTFPAPKDAELAEEGKGRSPRPAAAVLPSRQAFYMLKGDSLIIADQKHLLTLIADRLDDASKNALADVEDFRIVRDRCLADMPEGLVPDIAWYIEPLNYGESVRVLVQGPVAQRRRNKPSVFAILKSQGFDAIRGIGGTANLKAEEKETVYRIFVYTKKPYRLAMRMLQFPDATNFVPPAWMPPDLARCTMFYVDPLAIFDNFGTLFDSLIMQGEEGVWNDILEGLEKDPDGPQINLREELVSHLSHRVLGMSKYQLPIDTNSESIVVAVELKEGREDAVKKALQKLLGDDIEMEQQEHNSYLLWHRLPAEDVIQPFAGPAGVPGLVAPNAPAPAAAPAETPAFPDGTITVGSGYLFVSTNMEYLKTILDRVDSEAAKIASIGSEAEYREIDRIFESMGLKEKAHFMQFFARTDETIRPTYELIRLGKMPQSQAILGKFVNSLFVTEDDETGQSRDQAIDGSHLPEFDTVSEYFGPAGIYGISEENGYFFKGFLLEKKADEEIDAAEEETEEAAEGEETEKPAATGSVTLDGEPLKGGKIEFRPVNGDAVIEAEVKEDGTYEMEAEPGKVNVVVKAEAGKVSGKVLLDGEPLTVGTICFVSDTVQARAILGKDGKYFLGSLEDGGIPVGDYAVYFTEAIELDDDGDPVAEPVIPKKYRNAKTSQLKISVQPGGNTVDFVLETKSE